MERKRLKGALCIPLALHTHTNWHIHFNMLKRWLRRRAGEGIKTKPKGGVGGKLRDLGWKSASHLTVIGTFLDVHTLTLLFKKPKSIMTIREGEIT